MYIYIYADILLSGHDEEDVKTGRISRDDDFSHPIHIKLFYSILLYCIYYFLSFIFTQEKCFLTVAIVVLVI